MTAAAIFIKRLSLWTIVLCVFALQLTLPACSVGKDEGEALLSAQTSFANGSYSKAIIELKQILQDNSGNSEARQLLARCYLKKGDGFSAEKEITTVINDRSPTSAEQLILLSSWDLQGKYEKIVKVYEEDGLNDIEPMQVWEVVSHAYINEKKLEQGTALARKMLETDQSSTAALRSLANAASIRNDNAEAAEYLQRAMEIDKEDYKVWRDLAAVHVQLEDHAKAVELLQGALSLINENDPDQDSYLIRVNLIHLFFHLNRLDESEQFVRDLEARHKKNPYVDYLAGLYSYLIKDYEGAVTKLTRAYSAMPNHLPTVLLLGALHYFENNLEQANILLTRYVNQVPTHLQARKLLGEIKLKLDKPKEVLALLESGGVETDDEQILTMIGLAASQSGEYSRGIEFLKKAADANPADTRIREELARLYINHGSVDEAITELKDEWVGESTKRDALLILSYIRKQDFDSARKLSDQILARDDRRAEDLYLRAMIELYSGSRNAARRYFTDAVNTNSELISAQLALARMDLEDGRLIAGGDRLNLVLAREPKNVNAMMLLAQISERSGAQKEALAWLEKAVELGENAWQPRLVLARYYLRRKETEKAAAYLDHETLRKSSNPAIISMLAMIDEQTGNYKQAETNIKKLLDTSPQTEVAYLQLANLQTKRGDVQAARATLQKLDKVLPKSLKGKLLRYKLEMREKNFKQVEAVLDQLINDAETKYIGVTLQGSYYEAKGDLDQAIKGLESHVAPETPFMLIQRLSELYVKRGTPNDAIALLTNWKKAHQDHQQAQLALAIIYQTTGKANAAVKIYNDLLEANPRNIVALNNSALLNFDRNPQLALDRAKRAYEISGNASLSVVDTYAWLTHKMGDTATALQILAPIMDKASDPSILYHYAVMLAESDKANQAHEVLVKITQDHIDFPESEAAKKLLSEISQIKG
ncbi:MAG: XrtA/PEP-CTERM system TPR-repeat protein PrsT [Candidatus Thiodiazotropha sp.]